MFSDEKLFTIEQHLNRQNDRVWSKTKSSVDADLLRVTRRQKPSSVMVWAGVTASGRTPLVFVPEGVKINAQKYQEIILEGCLKPWAQSHFGKKSFTFQQDSAPAHKARTTQAWLQANVPSFIKATEWPPNSPDLNPLDYSIWGILESKVCSARHKDLDSLKCALKKAWNEIPQEVVRASAESFNERLKLLIKSKGGYFENLA